MRRPGEASGENEKIGRGVLKFVIERLAAADALESSGLGKAADGALKNKGVKVVIVRQENAEEFGALVQTSHNSILGSARLRRRVEEVR